MNRPTSATPAGDFSALQAEHPEAYRAWVQEGVDQERERVRAHLEMAKLAPGHEPKGLGLRMALAAIKSGEPIDMDTTIQYANAAVNQRDIDAREADERDVHAALVGRRVIGDDDILGAQVADRFEQLTGVQRG